MQIYINISTQRQPPLIPHFYNGNYTTTYEYLNQRFSSPALIRLSKYVFLLQTTLYSGIVIYAPALALSSLNIGLDLWPCVILTAAICTFYTTLGGLKAVIWTDVFQSIIMLTGFFSICAKGLQLYSLSDIFQTAARDRILNFDNFNPDPRVRHSFWAIVIGGTFGLWLPTFAVNQTNVQRYMSCKNLVHAKLTLVATIVNLWLLMLLALFSGYVMNRFFKDHPIPAAYAADKDKYIPFLVGNLFENANGGMMGLYVAAIYSGTLSTVSSSINSMSTVVSENIVFPEKFEFLHGWFSKIMAVVFGFLCMATAYVASKLGGVLEAGMVINSLAFSPNLGLFFLGMFFTKDKVEKVGAMAGYASGIVVSGVVYILNKRCEQTSGDFVAGFLQKVNQPSEVAGGKPDDGDSSSEPPPLVGLGESISDDQSIAVQEPHGTCSFYMSYLYISICGLVTTIAVGLLVSAMVIGRQARRGLAEGTCK